MKFQFSKSLASSFDADSFIGIQPQVFGDKSIGMVELSHSYGFAARPADPDPDGTSCQVLYAFDNSESYAWLANDPRVQSKLPPIKPGETFVYGSTGAFLRMGNDGVISLFTTDDTTIHGRSVFQQIGPTGFTFVFPFGKMTFDATGFHVLHNSGARLDLGAIAAPAPLNALSSYATLSAAMVHVEGSAVHVGTATGVPQPGAMATAVLALATAVQGVLTALGVPGAFICASPSSAAVPGPGLLSAIAAAETALTAAATAIPSVSFTATGA